jgi:hypothetical protein
VCATKTANPYRRTETGGIFAIFLEALAPRIWALIFGLSGEPLSVRSYDHDVALVIM